MFHSFLNRSSIQSKLILLLCILLAPTLLIQVYVYHNRFKDRLAEELQSNLEIARALAKSFDTYVMDIIHSELVIGLAITSNMLTSQERDQILGEFEAGSMTIIAAFWINPDGTVIGSSSEDYIGRHFSEISFFKKIVKGKKWAVSELIPVGATAKPCFIVSRGIRDKQGKLLGIVGALMEPDLMDDVLGIERAKGAAINVLDSKGMLVYRYPRFYPPWEERNWLRKLPELEITLNGVEYAWRGLFNGRPHIMANVPVRSIGWLVGADSRQEDTLSTIRAALLPQTIMFLLISLAAFVMALLFSRRISNAIGKLRSHALALGRGETRSPIEVSGASELDDLAKAFNQMTGEMESREKERQRAEDALRESEERLRLFIGHAPASLAMFDRSMRYLSASRRWLADYNLEQADLTGLSHYEVFPEIPKYWKEVYRRGLAGEVVRTDADRFDRADGSVQWLRWEVRPWYDAAGDVGGIVIFSEDITKRQEMERDLRKAHDDLELRVRERTEELSATVARLELVNAELQEFAFVASHDLQEPLRKIQTFCDMAQKRCGPALDSISQDYLDRAINSASRMRQLLSDLLQFSRAAKKQEPFEKVDLVKIVREAVDVFEETVKNTGALVDIESMPTIEADEGQMLRLFQNLIGNSLKFRSDEIPRVKVHGKLVGRRACEIFVEDNGIGFEPQFFERIFKPFQRLHGRSEYEGTGMGLAICRKIVERHGGSIRAQSEPGKGSTFIIRLPVKQQKAYSG